MAEKKSRGKPNEKCHWTQEQTESLAAGIVLQAVKDYERAIIENDEGMKRDCERFFEGKWMKELSHIDGFELEKKLKDGATKFDKLSQEHCKLCDESGKKNDEAFKCPLCGGNCKTYKARKNKMEQWISRCDTCGCYSWYKRFLVITEGEK